MLQQLFCSHIAKGKLAMKCRPDEAILPLSLYEMKCTQYYPLSQFHNSVMTKTYANKYISTRFAIKIIDWMSY
jgi:hypothetical protein